LLNSFINLYKTNDVYSQQAKQELANLALHYLPVFLKESIVFFLFALLHPFVSLLHLFAGPPYDLLSPSTVKGPRETFYYYFGKNNLEAIRYKHWKLVLPHNAGSYAAAVHGKDGSSGKIPRVNVPLALYDLAHDPGEAYDVQTLYPDILQKLQSIAEQAREDLGDDLMNRAGTNERKAGGDNGK
jgi:hypothetical protein